MSSGTFLLLICDQATHPLGFADIVKTRRFMKRNWVAFMIVNISELEKGNGELYMHAGNLNITMVNLRFS